MEQFKRIRIAAAVFKSIFGGAMKKVYGYIRVSTREQNEDWQFIALLDVGVSKENIYIDKQSGKNFERLQYQKMLRKLKKAICFMSKVSTV